MNQPICYLNGDFVALGEARIPVLDRGFLFGDGVYEVIPAYGGLPFRLEPHLARLENSLKQIGLSPPLDRNGWLGIFHRLLDSQTDQSIYLQITRGVTAKRDHAFPQPCRPSVFVMATPLEPASSPSQGVSATVLPDNRWLRCDIKATALLANILLRQEAVQKDCTEAILVRDGVVTEGAASNVFAVIGQSLITPPKSPHLLPGITRDLVLELAAAHAIPAREATLPVATLRSASEIWLTSSTREILPVVELDGNDVGCGRPGPLWKKMVALYQNYKRSFGRDFHERTA